MTVDIVSVTLFLLQSTVEQNSVGPVLLANALPRLISHPIQHVPSTPVSSCRSESSPLSTQSTPSIVPAPMGVTTSNAPGPPSAPTTLPRVMSQPVLVDGAEVKTVHSAHTQPLTIDTNNTGPVIEGPPTPTHSEIPDCTKSESC